MAGVIKLVIDPALEVSEASPDEQLWQDVAEGLASGRKILLQLVAINDLADRQVQPLKLGLILLVEPGNGDMGGVEFLPEPYCFLSVFLVGKNLSVLEILEDQIGNLVA